jgi:flagellar assembly protein FliH
MGRVVKADAVDRAALAPLDTSAAKAAAALVIRANRAKERIASEAKHQVIDLSLTMAREIVLREIAADSEVLGAIYGRALEFSRGMERGVVRVHPDDRARYPVDELASGSGFDCADDPAVGRGGCVIAAGGEAVDATLDTALGCFEAAMKEET